MNRSDDGKRGQRGWGLPEERLRQAAADVRTIAALGYPRDSVINFVGNRFQLGRTERDILLRMAFARADAQRRRKKMVRAGQLSGRRLIVDGYNVTITLESAMSGRLIVLADDGFVRDVSRIFRSFRPTDQTRQAWQLIFSFLRRYPPSQTLVFLDKPFSKSGELASRIRRWMKDSGLAGDCRAAAINERQMGHMAGIKASADTVIIDESDMVFDLAGHIIRRRLRLRPFRC
jgi:hypothetical protein